MASKVSSINPQSMKKVPLSTALRWFIKEFVVQNVTVKILILKAKKRAVLE